MIPTPFPHRRVGGGLAALAAFAVLFAAPSVSRAQGSAPALPKNSGKEYLLTRTSSFSAPPADSRDPFWPIGWVPTAAVQAAVVLSVKPEDFNVTTISVDFPALAVINGKTRAVGDRIPVGPAGTDFVSVKQILDGVVLLDYHGREMRVTNGGAALRKPVAK